MRQAAVAVLALAVLLAAGAEEVLMGQTKAPEWVRVVEHAAWAPRDSCGEFVYDGKMWLLGGWFTSEALSPRDVWSSANGTDWVRVTPEAGWEHGDIPTSLVHDGRMWMMGGWYGGRLSVASGSSQVWSSTDGARWECVTRTPGWSPRLGAGGAVFNGRMWILGGAERYFDGGGRHLRSDVWWSANGKDWTQATAEAPWAGRAYHGALAFKGKLWVFGGGNYRPDYAGFNDVWSSPDGEHWTRVTEHAPWSHRIWFSALVYRDRMWVLGGWSDNPSRNWNDVWYTEDGEHWTELKTETVWSPRHEQSAYVFQDKIWIVGGNEWPLVNDVWRLDLPESWPASR